MAHDDNFVSRDISAAEIYYERELVMEMADITTSDEDKEVLLEEASRLGETIKNVVFSFYENGKVETEEWYNDDGELSRMDGPASVRYGLNGLSTFEMWYNDREEHRLDGPAVIIYYTNDNNSAEHIINLETWRKNGKMHRDGGEPSMRGYFIDGSIKIEHWAVDGNFHRIGAPAVIAYHENGNVTEEKWYQHGEMHRLDGPALVMYYNTGELKEMTWYHHNVIHRNAGLGPTKYTYYESDNIHTTTWYQDGVIHCEGGPAIVTYYDNTGSIQEELWYLGGELHRADGPAKITYNDMGSAVKEMWYQHNEL